MAALTHDALPAWFAGRLPDGWFTSAPEVTADREEVLVVGTLAEPAYPEGSDATAGAAAQAAAIERFREETRGERMRIADDAERRTGRKVAWGARAADAAGVHQPLRAGDDSLAHARAPGARHPRRRGSRAESIGCARLVCPTRA